MLGITSMKIPAKKNPRPKQDEDIFVDHPFTRHIHALPDNGGLPSEPTRPTGFRSAIRE